jgi:hypothetical protein
MELQAAPLLLPTERSSHREFPRACTRGVGSRRGEPSQRRGGPPVLPGWKLTLLLREPFLKKREHSRFVRPEIV